MTDNDGCAHPDCRQQPGPIGRSWLAVASLAAILVLPSVAEAQIMGGQPVDIRDVPWQAALRITRGDRSSLCGGSLIRANWILTAAHCLLPRVAVADVLARTGSDDADGGRWLPIEQIVIHERYDPTTFEADLALVELAVATEGTPIALPEADAQIQAGTPLMVTGWGATVEGGKKSPMLMMAVVPYVDTPTCNAPQSLNGRVHAGMLCAGEVFGGVDACQGDSGGPLVERGPARPTLVGVVSFGVGCGRKLKFGVYTRVSAFRDWIERVIGSGKASP